MTNIKDYRTALLSYRTPEQWRSTPIDGRAFRGVSFGLEGRTLTGTELVDTYKTDFPDKDNYSNRGHLNRMLHNCRIDQFDYTDPKNIRGFLMSAKSEEEWKDWELNGIEFKTMQFQYLGVSKKGQKLSIDFLTDEENKNNGTFYSIKDYFEKPELRKDFYRARSIELIQRMFITAGLEVRYKDIQSAKLTSEEIRKILLGYASEEEWKNKLFDSAEFTTIRFSLRPYKTFSGQMLIQALRKKHTGLSLDQMFSKAGIMTGRTNPELAREARVVKYNEDYSCFSNPENIREIMMQLYSPEEWGKTKDFESVRKKNIKLDEKKLNLHTFLQMYSVHKFNQEQERSTGVNPYYTLSEMQKHENETFHAVPASNSTLVREFLEMSGIDSSKTFAPNITDFDLRNPELLRKILSNGYYQGLPVDMRRVVDLPEGNGKSGIVRNTIFREPETGVEISGHGLMIYYTTQEIRQKNPKLSKKESFNRGQSNLRIMREMVTLADL